MASKYEIFVTRDGSPTLQWIRTEDGYGEKMHHSAGALSESLFIYHECLKHALAAGWPARILSLGLGLGYNELIAVAALRQTGIRDWKIWSFEVVDFLRDEFRQWLEGQDSQLSAVYDNIAILIASHFQIPSTKLKADVYAGWSDGRLELRAGFPQDSKGVEGCTNVFYDAFSKKMDPELWDEATLASNLNPLLSRRCVLATYAATGSLNRALKSLGFRLTPRTGFQGKRESTLAIRE